MKKLTLILILFASVYYSQEFKKTATSGFSFLQIPVTARAAALGEASVALSDLNSDAIFHNPGVLGFTKLSHSFSSSYSTWFADIKNYGASYSYSSSLGVLGIGFLMLDYGEMPRTVIASGQKVYNVIGNFNANASALSLSYSKMLTDKFSFGVALKYVQEKIDVYDATNILFDAGVIYYTGLGSLRLASAIQNFGVDTKFINDKFKMPAVLRIGLAGEVFGSIGSEYRVTLVTEAIHPNDAEERINVGTEVAWNETVILRGGYKFFYDEETYSLGIGINPNLFLPVQFDFAFSDYGRLGNITRFTIQLGVN